MKKLFTILTLLLLTVSVFAQAPERMTYQAVVRDADGQLLTNTQVGIKVSIQKHIFGIPPMPPSFVDVYVETHSIYSTNDNGLLTVIIGAGQIESGNFANINWGEGIYYINTEIDPEGGTNYTIEGKSPLLSVPYALHANTVDEFTETDPSVPSGNQVGEMQYWNGTEWVTLPAGDEGQTLKMVDGVPTWTTPGVNDVVNPATGKIWMDRNLGALRAAGGSKDDAAYGYLYQWGRATDGHQVRTSGTTSTLSNSNTPGHGKFITVNSNPYDWRSPQNDNLWQGVNGINNPCPEGYRLPTSPEWQAERSSWSSNNAEGAFASPLKLPMAGTRSFSNGSLGNVGSIGLYWSGTVHGSSSRGLSFISSNAAMGSYYRALGLSARCLKD